jgi:hypothetical protein
VTGQQVGGMSERTSTSKIKHSADCRALSFLDGFMSIELIKFYE